MCDYKNICVLGGVGCEEGFCDERERLIKLAKEPCPIMVKNGYAENLCACDMPLALRAQIPHNISCVENDNCILAIYFPKLRGDAGKLKLDHEEITHLSAIIKAKLRSVNQGQCKLTLTPTAA
jgi:hypothetical protein